MERVEGMLLNALAEKGYTYRDGKVVSVREPEEKDGEAVDKQDEVRYNKSDELYTASDEFIRDVAPRDRHDFSLSLSKQTNGMKSNTTKTISIKCLDRIYIFKANGYMQGSVIDYISSNSKEVLAGRSFENDREKSNNRRLTGIWADLDAIEHRGQEDRVSILENKRSKSRDDSISDSEQRSNGTRDNGRVRENYRETQKEIDEIVKKLREMYVESGEDQQNIRLSRAATPTAEHNRYLSAVQKDDMETAQKMVEEAAKRAFAKSKIRDENGNLLKVYHGTDSDFTVFDKTKGRSGMDIQGMFFSPWEIDAKGYGKNVRAFYLNIANPASEGKSYRVLNSHKGENYAGIKAREDLERMGYDGVNNSDEEFIAFNSNQIKSADPVTYDDDGNVIPLSERFNEQNSDIRFSLGGSIDNYTQKQYNDYGWARANDIISASESEELRSKFADAVKRKIVFPKTKSGEYMIEIGEIGQKIAFMHGTITNPFISSVIEIDAVGMELDEKRRELYASERRGIQPEIGEFFRRYNSIDFQTQWNGQRNGTKNVIDNDRIGLQRGGSGAETDSVVRKGKKRAIAYHFNEDGSQEITYSDGSKEIRFSKGQNAKFAANNTGERVYSKKLAKAAIDVITESNLVFGDLYSTYKGTIKGKGAIIDELFYKLNRTQNKDYQRAVANDIAKQKVRSFFKKDLTNQTNCAILTKRLTGCGTAW